MTPAGYMAKRVVAQPDWIGSDAVSDIYSLSNCVSEDFADYINSWKHNAFWLFDSPAVIELVSAELKVSLSGTSLFYYEIHELEFDRERCEWVPFMPEHAFKTDVVVPATSRLEGYDVVSCFGGSSPECSPLSCNGLASSLPVNRHCLLASFQETVALLESRAFEHSEPGPLRIFSVSSVPWPVTAQESSSN